MNKFCIADLILDFQQERSFSWGDTSSLKLSNFLNISSGKSMIFRPFHTDFISKFILNLMNALTND